MYLVYNAAPVQGESWFLQPPITVHRVLWVKWVIGYSWCECVRNKIFYYHYGSHNAKRNGGNFSGNCIQCYCCWSFVMGIYMQFGKRNMWVLKRENYRWISLFGAWFGSVVTNNCNGVRQLPIKYSNNGLVFEEYTLYNILFWCHLRFKK